MELSDIENKLKELVKNINKEQFIYDLLLVYGFPKATISRLKTGDSNLSKNSNEILLKKKVLFKIVTNEDPHDLIDRITNNNEYLKHEPRFIIVTDFLTLLAVDLKTKDTLDIEIAELDKYYDFFLPWIGKEKFQSKNESAVDIKAANKMGQLYDILTEENPSFILNAENKHALNIFFARLLFCLFAEDTEIFKESLFTNCLATHTKDDGSDLKNFLNRLFTKLNTKDSHNETDFLKEFPYVNGGLFKDIYPIPDFSRKSRTIIIQAGQLDWKAINPDIFGSMVQAIADPQERASLGVHYTSVTNILKLINPLFMDDLYDQFNNAKNEKDLEKILNKIYSLKIFDPACGSGNFLIVSYKELCKLEMMIYKSLLSLNSSKWSIARSGIRLNQFYGITLKDFDAEIAKLSLWLSEHQVNAMYKETFGTYNPTLPLQAAGHIVSDNSTRINWKSFCKQEKNGDIFIVGNPPYLGSKRQSADQKRDMEIVFEGYEKYANIDYIGCWFKLAADYIDENTKAAFVSTNSIVQGTTVYDLWKNILSGDIEIDFAITDFPWANNATKNAAVMCVIISLRKKSNKPKFLIDNNTKIQCKNINAYLMNAPSIYIERRNKPLSQLPEMIQGNIPLDNGNLRLTSEEKNSIIASYPLADRLFKKTTGSDELINDISRWCLWIGDDDLEFANSIPPIKKRIDEVYTFRANGAENAKACLNRSHQFCMTNVSSTNQAIIPIVSSVKRKYLPIGIVDSECIVMNSALLITNFENYILGVISSKMHMLWVKTFGGKLHSNLRYSVGVCWYSFPFPKISDQKKKTIEHALFKIMDLREKYSNKTLAQLYDDSMPSDLVTAHNILDLEIDTCYSDKPFTSETQRLETLFNIYSELMKENDLAHA